MALLQWYPYLLLLGPWLSAGIPTLPCPDALNACTLSLDTCSALLSANSTDACIASHKSCTTSLDLYIASLDKCTASLAGCLASGRAPAAVSSSATDEPDLVFNTRYRSTMEIVWSCLTIVFASTWVCVHPNVTGYNTKRRHHFLKRVKLLLLTLFAPELLAVVAFYQWRGSRSLHHEFREEAQKLGISLKLGPSDRGNVLQDQNAEPKSSGPLEDNSQELPVGPEVPEKTPKIEGASGQADDNSGPSQVSAKRSRLDSIKAVLHWYDVDKGETAWTLTHAHFIQMGGVIFKRSEGAADCDIGFKVPVIGELYLTRDIHTIGWTGRDLRAFFDLKISKAAIQDKSKGSGLAKAFVVMQVLWFVVQTFARKHEGLPITHLEVVCLAFTAFNIGMHICWWGKPLDVEYPLEVVGEPGGDSPAIYGGLSRWVLPLVHGLGIHPVGQWAYSSSSHRKSYPGLYCHRNRERRIQDSILKKYFSTDEDFLGGGFALGLAFTSASFGALHAIGWFLPFPSYVERMLWRVSCLVLVAYPLIPLTFIPIPRLIGAPEPREAQTGWKANIVWCLRFISCFGAALYLGARLVLIVLPFLELRALPPQAHQAVSWSNFLPHV